MSSRVRILQLASLLVLLMGVGAPLCAYACSVGANPSSPVSTLFPASPASPDSSSLESPATPPGCHGTGRPSGQTDGEADDPRTNHDGGARVPAEHECGRHCDATVVAPEARSLLASIDVPGWIAHAPLAASLRHGPTGRRPLAPPDRRGPTRRHSILLRKSSLQI